MNPASLAAASDSVDVSGSLMIALLRVCLIVAVFVPVWSARPWAELYVGSLGATARIEWTAAVIDGWLVLAGVPGRRRRVVRAELRADLWRAAGPG